MRFIAGLLAGLSSLYMLLITVRIVLTWFSRGDYGKPQEILRRFTDPYLDWFRRFPVFQTGTLDLSPIAALAVLSAANQLFYIMERTGRVTLGLVLGMLTGAAWSAASMLLWFFIIVLGLRFFASRFRPSGVFWHLIDTVSRPVLHRITRLFFRDRLINYRQGFVLSIGVLAAALLLGNLIIKGVLLPLLLKLPL